MRTAGGRDGGICLVTLPSAKLIGDYFYSEVFLLITF
jgi:hypothetical protein